MKHSKLLLTLLAATSLTACTEKETFEPLTPDTNKPGKTVEPTKAEQLIQRYAANLTSEQSKALEGESEVYMVYPTQRGMRSKRVGVTQTSEGTSLAVTAPVPTAARIYTLSGAQAIPSVEVSKPVLSTGDEVVRVSEAGVEAVDSEFFLEQFPEGENHENALSGSTDTYSNFSQNFLYKSDGNGFEIYPVFSNGAYVLRLGVFYFDAEGNRHDVEVWDMAKSYGTEGPWKNVDAATELINPTQSRGVHIDIPKDYVYGFYIYNYSKHDADGYGHEYRSYDETTGEYYKGTYYSYKELNTVCGTTGERFHEWANPYRNHGHLNNDEGAPRVNGECHAITITHDGQTYIGFEDSDHEVWDYAGQSWSNYSSDRDFNDLILRITPVQRVISGPSDNGEGDDEIREVLDSITRTPRIPDGIVCEADDFQLNFNNDSHKVIAYGGTVEDGLLKYDKYLEGVDVLPVIKIYEDNATGFNLDGAVRPYSSENIADPTDPNYELTTMLLQGGHSVNKADVQTAHHNSGRVLFDVDGDESYNDLVLDYDFEALQPADGQLTSRDRELRVTLHVRAMGSNIIDEAGVVINGIGRKVALGQLQWINTDGKAFAYTDAQGNAQTFNPASLTSYNVVQDSDDPNHLLTIDVRFHLSAADIDLAIASVLDASKQIFYVKTTDGNVTTNGIKLLALAPYPAAGSTLTQAYPAFPQADWWQSPVYGYTVK